MKENKNIKDTELNLDDLNEVNGGMFASMALDIPITVLAYCKSCGRGLKDLGTKRINGGTTNIFMCTNNKCKEYNKEKNNLEVKRP